MSLSNIDGLAEIETLEVRRPYKKVDILVLVNNDVAILIEDKANTNEHSNQLRRYLETVHQDFPGRKVAAIFFKTGDQSDYKAVKQAGYACFSRRQFLDILRYGEQKGVRNEIFVDFHSYLQQIETAVGSYQHLPIVKWGKDRNPWTGFFLVLQERLGDGQWNYVHLGDFMGFWWHSRETKKLQLEECRLCFKIRVDDQAQQAAERNKWHDILLDESRDSELRLRKPRRWGTGRIMTAAELDGDYLQTNSQGILDLDKTVAVLRKAVSLLDSAVQRK